MTSPLRMKRQITRRARTTWTRTAASLLAALLCAGSAYCQELPPPEMPAAAGRPVPIPPPEVKALPPPPAPEVISPAIEQAVFTTTTASQGAAQQLQPPRSKERGDESFDFSVVTELPGPDRFFRRQGESDYFQRIREEGKRLPGTGRIIFPEETPLTKETYAKRHFPHIVKGVEPAYVCHGRLFFEQPNFERQGWDLGILTPFTNVGVYYYDLAMLPYHAFTNPLQCTDCSAGKCLPGDPTPLYLYPEKLSITGLAAEATVVTGLFYLFP